VVASRIEWDRLKATTIVAESVQVALALLALALDWITFPLLLLLLAVEVVAIVALSGAFYRERSLRRRLIDVAKILAMCAFCAIFHIAAYVGAGGFARGPVIDLPGVGALAALIVVRLLVVAAFARRSGDARLAWTREALQRGGVLATAMFLSIFLCFIPGVPLAALLLLVAPEVAADVAIGGVLLLVIGAAACLMSTMDDRELADIARNPYID
jgi:hypothetical protein